MPNHEMTPGSSHIHRGENNCLQYANYTALFTTHPICIYNIELKRKKITEPVGLFCRFRQRQHHIICSRSVQRTVNFKYHLCHQATTGSLAIMINLSGQKGILLTPKQLCRVASIHMVTCSFKDDTSS